MKVVGFEKVEGFGFWGLGLKRFGCMVLLAFALWVAVEELTTFATCGFFGEKALEHTTEEGSHTAQPNEIQT